jgi:type VI secretion system protein ImpM
MELDSMRCGLFGKLPAKRDFIAMAAPREFLRVWEPFLEMGLRHGGAHLAPDEWKAAFNSAPIWRFWLGPELCGGAIVGAFMPSVDALGRLFPLTLIGMAAGAEPLASPDIDSRGSWFARTEDFLLGALSPDASLETIAAGLDDLCAESPSAALSDAFTEIFSALRVRQPDCSIEAASFWWTIGGNDCQPLALMQKFMPSPATFTNMLSRCVENRPEATVQLG